MIPPATDLTSSRARVLGAAEAAGATLARYTHPEVGPDGEALTTDTARFGAPIGDARTVLLVSSGVHGVEGHAGSGVQELLVGSGRLERLPADVAVVLVHAVNPYGFAWSRRVDHQNIDVNRNFVDYADLPENPRYGEVDPILNPTDFDPDDTSFLGDLLAFWSEVGDDVAFRTISGGQYSHPRGVQFGGQGASWSRRTMEQVWARELVEAEQAVALDVHTGLGPLGRLTVFQTADEHEAAAEMGAAWYPEQVYRADRSGSVDHGLLGVGFDEWAADRPVEVATFVLEVGTHEPTQGVTVFRADNWLHHHGDPTSLLGEQIRGQVRDFFFVDDEGWRTDTADQVLTAVHTALDAV